MSILLKNALLFDIDPIGIGMCDLFIEDGVIKSINGQTKADEVIDCGGAVVMPGLVNGHTHLYSALAVGMPPPAVAPANFLEILQKVWWKLDQALDAETIALSARIGAIQAALCGTTTLIDHHASPNCIDGSLDLIESGLKSVGLRGVLCYETTDRHGKIGRDAGLMENQRFVERSRLSSRRQFAGLIGAHASFTLDDDSLDNLAAMAKNLNSGVHIHVAEDPCDEQSCRQKHGIALIDRLARHGLLSSSNLLAHCIHLDDRAIGLINESAVSVAHNPRSNMNNSVGYAPIDKFQSPVLLGTDGIGADLFAEAQSAWFKSRDAQSNRSPDQIIGMLRSSARKASQVLGLTLGRLAPGAAADIIVTDYKPFTPMNASNASAHFVFGMSSRQVRHVIVDGQWVVRDRLLAREDAAIDAAMVQDATKRLWQRMARID